ncbi:PTS system alpha-glucoside-specific EIICB component [Clostridium pasteurianum DSM 525 = ATCC 6013]|uniref:PTS system alpha-glucoside-specific EIICB component n=1 Tax=Clostridium pasteurianum DSM 525 = ATCC 6013 TaxID=1262449 RepID=A0A0H3J3B5_CLOPA|nr:PTS transporter subunit EIIC [Clostridium pasteurianum]AJA47959.1 PTS system alpha-glucoside-specific EIICB component [Clostridium pasteurianum DSM 525 = ATCC 6013]AJA51947.1 PTS system alpha-glucoside-specific EIICB component [Clostridium pasteurianum DSM 525 = ATCC 6013]AOZ75246.1 PTS glucose transporter subunit IIBC [Clostridium pasteurianum DSM 525 = ATCC 6013]AOZ79041.1 PTS glucose transporter subunit IIBC [Clostridium pasteurianum]ELP59862.1 PTS system glucose/glucoside family transpo
MKDKIVNGMQIFARSIVTPILFLPIVGILLAIVGVISNPSIVGEGSPLINVGEFVGGGLWTFLTNLSIIFCVGIAMGMAKEKKAEAALVSVFSFLFFLGANHAWLSLTGKLINYKQVSDLAGTGQTVLLGFQVIDMGVFLGMILGITIALVHNKFCNKEFPEAVAIYGNTKLVFLILIPILLILAIVLSYVWPTVALAIKALTTLINSSGFFGIALYGFLNRFLIPTGLHHLIYTPFLYSDIGGSLMINGKTYLGAYNIFLAQLTDPSIKVFDPSAKFLQFGMVKIFGLAGAALAFYKTAKPENKEKLKGILIPAVATSMLVGITEPLEFTFLFVSPLLWLVHSIMDGLFEAVAVLFGVRTFGSDGLINFVVYNLPAGIGRTRWPIYIGIGLVQLGVYYLVFKTLIQKLKLKTPGREDSEVKLFTKKDYKGKKSKDSKQIEENEKDDLAAVIVEALGGKDNIESVDNCFTRLRVKITDLDKLDEATLKTTGASGVIKNGNNVQVIYGPKVNGVRNKVDKYLGNN